MPPSRPLCFRFAVACQGWCTRPRPVRAGERMRPVRAIAWLTRQPNPRVELLVGGSSDAGLAFDLLLPTQAPPESGILRRARALSLPEGKVRDASPAPFPHGNLKGRNLERPRPRRAPSALAGGARGFPTHTTWSAPAVLARRPRLLGAYDEQDASSRNQQTTNTSRHPHDSIDSARSTQSSFLSV